jgi:hypothetical protein
MSSDSSRGESAVLEGATLARQLNTIFYRVFLISTLLASQGNVSATAEAVEQQTNVGTERRSPNRNNAARKRGSMKFRSDTRSGHHAQGSKGEGIMWCNDRT